MTVIDRYGIMRVESRRQQKFPTENNRDDIEDYTFKWNPLFLLSAIVLLIGVMILSYKGYLDTRAVNYPFQGPKV